MKTVGVIGGLGPETTVKFYLEVLKLCFEKNKAQRPQILIESVPLFFELEKQVITENKQIDKILPILIQAAKTLEKAGADFIVMPCNSLHVFVQEIRHSVKIPVLSIVEETVKQLLTQSITQIGLVATSITIESGLYEQQLIENHIQITLPDAQQQKKINQSIHNLVIGKVDKHDQAFFAEVLSSFKQQGVRTVVLACTDLQLVISYFDDLMILDTMQLLAIATTREVIT
ncbi:amino acid racemase [Patescibacteria group bacterium]|nr:amino acid racemase [Patescibacteria group bacterium]